MEDLIEFYDARDQFLALQSFFGTHQIVEGFKRLRGCCNMKGLSAEQLEEVRFVSELFGNVESNRFGENGYQDIRRAFLKKFNDFTLKRTVRSVAICYAAFVYGYDRELETQAIEMGHPLFLGEISWRFYCLDNRPCFDFAQRSAKAGDRVGLRNLGLCFETGRGCEIDSAQAITLYKQAALLQDGEAMYRYANLAFKIDNPCRYLWFGKAAQKGRFSSLCALRAGTIFEPLVESKLFEKEAVKHMNAFDYYSGQGCGPVLFMIGRMCKSILVDYGFSRENHKIMEQTVEIYHSCLRRAKNATLCWILCAKRLGLYKDISHLIAQFVWERRDSFVHTKNS